MSCKNCQTLAKIQLEGKPLHLQYQIDILAPPESGSRLSPLLEEWVRGERERERDSEENSLMVSDPPCGCRDSLEGVSSASALIFLVISRSNTACIYTPCAVVLDRSSVTCFISLTAFSDGRRPI